MLRRLLVLCCFLLLPRASCAKAAGKGGECRAPEYRVARTYSKSPEVEAIAISVSPKDVTLQNLLALACQIRADYPIQTEVGADIFNSAEAARWTNIHGVENSTRGNKAAYIATYCLNRKKGVETLTLAADPNHPCGNDIQIDLVKKQVSFVSCK